MFKFNKKKNDNETIISINMRYKYSGEWYDELLIIKYKKPNIIKVATSDCKYICNIDNGNELKIILESLLNGD